jgi:hypothetical protein
MRHETLSVIVGEISAEMLKAKETREDFELRDLRRTAEAMLASLKVPSDVHAQLLCHRALHECPGPVSSPRR